MTLSLSNLRQMGIVLNSYAPDYNEYPLYTPNSNWRSGAGLFVPGWAGNQRSGVISRFRMLPMLKDEGYLTSLEAGFTPDAWEQGFHYEEDANGNTTFVADLILDNVPYEWTPRYSSGSGNEHMNRGEYLYAGPGACAAAWWQKQDVSPRLIDEFVDTRNGTPNDRLNYHSVLYNGNVTGTLMGAASGSTDAITADSYYSGKRVPIMGEAGLQLVVNNGSVGSRTMAPHFSVEKSRSNFAANGGTQCFLFNDGSASTYPFSN